MTTQNLWQTCFYFFRCFDPTRKPVYMQDDDANDTSKLINNNDPPQSFVIIRY